MTDHPHPQTPSPEQGDGEETDLPESKAEASRRLAAGVHSTVVTGSIDDDDWSLGPVPSMPDSGGSPTQTDLKNLPAGSVLDDFQIQRVLGKGAFATVYLARQLSLNRFVALKVTGDLGHEGRRMARLDHANVVQVYSEQILEQQRIRLLSMQFVPGPTLHTALMALTSEDSESSWTGAELLKQVDGLSGSVMEVRPDDFALRQRLERMDHQEAACFLIAELAGGLDYAHRHEVLHRDIKPANILLNASGRPLLVDFNLAEEAGESTADQAMIGGTLAYMAPEHLRAFEFARDAVIPVGPKADLYSLVLVLVQILDGRVPLPRTDTGTPIGGDQALSIKVLRAMRSTPVEISIENPTPSESTLKSVIRRATDPVPEQRTESAAVLSEELYSCQRLREIESNRVMNHPLIEFAAARPVTVFAALGLVPQIVASVVNIIYNVVRMSELAKASDISQTQMMDAFRNVTIVYNVVVWPIGIVMVAILLRRSIKAIRMEACHTEEEETAQRQVIIGIPYKMLLIAAIGWAPGILVFPLGMYVLIGLSFADMAIHFALNFATCALIAVTYSYLGLAWYAVSVCWRRHWHFPRRFRKLQIKTEFRNYERDLRLARHAAAMVPLLSCVLLILSTTQQGHSDEFQWLELLLIGMGMLGPVFANVIVSRVTERIRTYAAR